MMRDSTGVVAGRMIRSSVEIAVMPVGVAAQVPDAALIGTASDDEIIGTTGHEYIFGNNGNDRLFGGDGNDHLYGFNIAGDPTADGDDTIRAGAGNDYVQGNAGDDLIYGEDGNDRLNGGAGGDNLSGGDGNDSINGNKGRDYIYAGAGNDTVRGGQDNDELSGDDGNDMIFGDLGNDHIYGGGGHDSLAGGQGSDIFGFFGGHARYAGGAPTDTIDTILDFDFGVDRFGIGLSSGIGTAPGNVLKEPGASFMTVSEALVRAQQLLDGNVGTSDVAALQVGSDTYLFYNDADGLVINSAIRVLGLTAQNLSSVDFAMLDTSFSASDSAAAA